ncbi:hypothetical protein DFH06DRAFT_564079 [Mycena polygramma]|nr:hypothetical protein DFH06DRAFT_564079 [Mycena polygramma]
MSAQVPRKLLVLDLNGTLLVRSAHTRRGVDGRPRRSVHPRPYLTSFSEYIFHPSTRVWLDTMVWSSAMPPSVTDMVTRCFLPHHRVHLRAIWARDTMGLSPALYNKKTQTTKDLAKPWAEFHDHNERTTFLLDDSARKAHLHPYNHVCVREYLSETRRHDLEVWRSTRSDTVPPKQGKAKSKKVVQSKPTVTTDAPPSWFLNSSKYDETLLAVVGVLETLKTQTNVAEWIRGGGLLGPKEVAVENSSALSPESLASQMSALKLAQEMWFDSEAAVSYWVSHGVHALETLQISIDTGIQGELVPS